MRRTMAESRLPVVLNQEYRVKLGKSFTFPKENSFHTIKYDFKPKSVDPSQPGRLKVEGEEVTVSLPLFQAGSFDDAAMFRGAKRPVQKECILIINKVTGEAVLERINTTVQLKSVRDGSKSKKLRSVSPLPTLKPTATNKPGPPSQQSSKPIRPLKQPKASKKPKEAKSHKVKGMGKASQSSMLAPPPPPSVPNVPPSQPPSVTQQFISLPDSISPLTSNNPTPEPGQLPPSDKKIRSFSSSSSSSSSKSGSLSDSDDSDMEQQLGLSPQAQQAPLPPPPLPPPAFIPEPTQPPLAAVPPEVGGMQSLSAESSSSCSSSSSSSSGSDDDSDSSSSSSSSSGAEEEENQGQVIAGSGYTNMDPSLSRPRSMSLLKEDLQLSDSDSD